MAQYLVLIYGDEQMWTDADPAERAQMMRDHDDFSSKAGAALVGGNELALSSTATSVRPAPNGNVTTTDGPFLDTKEVLGGYYLIEAADLDEALTVAKQVPMHYGGVEVRPVVDHS